MRRGFAAAALLLVVGCGPLDRAADPDPDPGAFELSTHCGIRELSVDGRWYEREGGVLDDGSGNPPAGWDNPFQRGTVTVTGDTAVFTDDEGHREVFVLREGATGPLQVCA